MILILARPSARATLVIFKNPKRCIKNPKRCINNFKRSIKNPKRCIKNPKRCISFTQPPTQKQALTKLVKIYIMVSSGKILVEVFLRMACIARPNLRQFKEKWSILLFHGASLCCSNSAALSPWPFVSVGLRRTFQD